MPDFIYTLGLLTENEKRSLSLSLFPLSSSSLLSFTRDHDKSEGDVALSSNVFPTNRKSFWQKTRRNCGPAKLINYAGANRRRAFLPVILHVRLLSPYLSSSDSSLSQQPTLLKIFLLPFFFLAKFPKKEETISREYIPITNFHRTDSRKNRAKLFHYSPLQQEAKLDFNIKQTGSTLENNYVAYGSTRASTKESVQRSNVEAANDRALA